MDDTQTKAADASSSQLVCAAANGDRAAWDGLVDRFARVVWSVARSMRLDHADAADVFQTTWLRLVEHIDRIDQPERVGAWLATTARRECLRVLRLSGRQLPCDATAMELFIEDVEASPEAGVMIDERDQALRAAFALLPPRCQLVLSLLARDEPASYRAIGEALDMPIGSIGPTRARCLEHLRRLAAAAGVNVPAEAS